ncbi:ABSCISIC ACID-INSENSITIVE 5-like protein 2 isoform X2 [Zingiber officinale]|uniref:ABSCISIC ACID-INSENSITIVE 5-like protein 2 isoform X2 n=1 Tax=Zingiber officinale TaxID=94328 RepID=UPI001C4C8466|nr:ABSCISIC ACID-INSENSITIVE 5-like protein 2 isoform X2 [Zingiber officinale]
MAAERDGGSDNQHYQIQSLSRQGSLYNLTLNEVQNHIGEPLLSMNLDDLLKTVFASEVNQLSGAEVDMPADQHAPTSGLLRQGSITMPCELSKKTVDEVWRDIQQEQKNVEVQRLGSEKQPTLGEMTLEVFLVKAGVVADILDKDGQELMGDVDPLGNIDPLPDTQNFTRGTGWLQQFQPMASMDKHMHGQQSMMGTHVSNRLLPHPSRKRGASEEIVDKLAERRQKRMIKNRESAARSRARKQAYTNELENKVSGLEEENERLKKLKELDEFVFSLPREPRYQLRRTSSAPL